MKTAFLVIGGLCAAFAALAVLESKNKQRPVEELAHKLEAAWADHHTVA